MIRAFLISLALLAQPALALDDFALGEKTTELTHTDPTRVVTAAVAACLSYPRDMASVISVFDFWQWDRSGEAGVVEINSGKFWVTLLGEQADFTCTIESHLSQTLVEIALLGFFIDTKWNAWERLSDSEGCSGFGLADGTTMVVTSGGQDPVCTPTDDSAIRIRWAALGTEIPDIDTNETGNNSAGSDTN